MQTAYIHLVKHALAEGCTISVWDGEEWQVKHSTGLNTIIEAVKSVEEAQLSIRQGGTKVGWALVSAYGLEPEETVMDFTMTEFMNKWDEIYMALVP
jgi:hypothetical protein